MCAVAKPEIARDYTTRVGPLRERTRLGRDAKLVLGNRDRERGYRRSIGVEHGFQRCVLGFVLKIGFSRWRNKTLPHVLKRNLELSEVARLKGVLHPFPGQPLKLLPAFSMNTRRAATPRLLQLRCPRNHVPP